jgi:gamma-butyrobetaine dioxygenase
VTSRPQPGIAAATLDDSVVTISFGDRTTVALHTLALRDACACSACRLPSGQRLFESHLALPGLRALSAEVTPEGRLEVVFSDGHRTLVSPTAAREEADAATLGARRSREITLWGAELKSLPRASYAAVIADERVFRNWLGAVAELGFAILESAPIEPGTVAGIAELFSPVRVTNYGRVFDVAVRVGADNLADSSLGLSLHTDNPYRQPQPTLQLLHCLSSSAAGGDTMLSDGFRAVETMRRLDPEALVLLATQPVRYAYSTQDAELRADVPIVALDPTGGVIELRINNRSKGTPVGPPARIERWYDAYVELHRLLAADDAVVTFRLSPGDVAVFDNGRVLHGRTAFSDVGERRLQGCYADRDALLSRLALLEREETMDE